MAVVGCYSPSPKAGAPCSENGLCPAGQHCNRKVEPPTCAAADAQPIDAPPDAPPTCADDSECDAAAPVCDLRTSTCRGCIADAECGADVCLEYEGTCANASNALFISPGGGGTCTRSSPCTPSVALTMVANNQRIIVVSDGLYQGQLNIQSSVNANSVTFSGLDRDPAGATVTPINTVPALYIENGAPPVIVEGITLDGLARGVDNRGVVTLSRVAVTGNAQDGIISTGAELHIWDSTIANNATRGIDVAQSVTEILRTTISGNPQGGIDLNNAPFTIDSCFITGNGELNATIGGARLQNIAGKSPTVFSFNTVAANLAANTETGVQCGDALAIDSSILVDGTSANCSATYSLFPTAAPPGTGNLTADPGFVGAGNFHITPTSLARDVANPTATNLRDIDGDPRPSNGVRDIGADEVP